MPRKLTPAQFTALLAQFRAHLAAHGLDARGRKLAAKVARADMARWENEQKGSAK